MNEPRRAPSLLLPALVVAFGYHLFMQLSWIEADSGDSSGVCCDMMGYMMDANRWLDQAHVWARTAAEEPLRLGPGGDPVWQLRNLASGAWHQLVWSPGNGWFQLLGGILLGLSGSGEFGYYIGTLSVLMTQLALAGLGWRLGSPMGGALAAALYPMMPGVSWIERRVDVYGFTAAMAALGAILVLRAASFSRWGPSAAFALLAVAGACVSPRPTDNLLLLLALAGLAALPFLRGLLLARDADGEGVPRLRVSLIGAVVGLVAGLALARMLGIGVARDETYLDYVVGEVDGDSYVSPYGRWEYGAWGAYSRHVVELVWTRWNAVGAGLCGLAWLARGRGRAELLGWALIPLVALSLLDKKNPYYLYMSLPALSLITGLGAGALPWRPLRYGVACALLGVAAAQHTSRSMPELVAGTPLARVQWARPSAEMDPAFQSPNWVFDLAPRPTPPTVEFAGRVVDALPVPSCSCNYILVAGGNTQFGELMVPMAMRDPCARLIFWPIPPDSDDVGAVLIGQRTGPPNADEAQRIDAVRAFALERFTKVDSAILPEATLEIWVRDAAWFQRFCASHGRPR